MWLSNEGLEPTRWPARLRPGVRPPRVLLSMHQKPAPTIYVLIAVAAIAVSLGAQLASFVLRHEGRPLRMLRVGARYAPLAGLSPIQMRDAVVWDGFDGQSYFYLARDLLVTPSTQSALDAPRLRARRIGFPLMGALLGGGKAGAAWGLLLAEALTSLGLLALVQAAAWRCRASPLWGLAVPMCLPFTLSRELVTAELPAALLIVAAVEARDREHRRLAVLLLGLAGLVKEVTLLAPLAFAAAERDRAWRQGAAIWLYAFVPFLLWESFLLVRVPSNGDVSALLTNLSLPGEGLGRALVQHLSTLVEGGRRVKALGLLLATGWYIVGAGGALLLCYRRRTPARVLAVTGALLVLLLRFAGGPQALDEVFNFGRQLFLLPTAAIVALVQEKAANTRAEEIGLGMWLVCGSVLGAAWLVQEIAMGG